VWAWVIGIIIVIIILAWIWSSCSQRTPATTGTDTTGLMAPPPTTMDTGVNMGGDTMRMDTTGMDTTTMP
jgi:hypothetical protein